MKIVRVRAGFVGGDGAGGIATAVLDVSAGPSLVDQMVYSCRVWIKKKRDDEEVPLSPLSRS